MRAHRNAVAAALVAVIAVGACSGGDDERDGSENGSSTATGSEDGSPGDAPCEPETGEQPARAVLRCGEPSIAYVATQSGTGTGVAIALDGESYVLTNQHVVDPYDAADVQFGAGEPELDVPLAGADVAADIALLGPIETRVPTLGISDSAGVERGDEVFLVGFPGESSGDEHDATIASGIVARLREAEEWDQRYIQTDAAIAGGQSGGPLFDDTGNLVGISGLSYAEEFALALSGEDVREAAERILDDGGDELLTVPSWLPAEGGSRGGLLSLAHAMDTQVLYLPPSDDARTWHLDVTGADASVSVQVADVATGQPIALNAASVTLEQSLKQRLDALGVPNELTGENSIAAIGTADVLARETTPGSFTIEVDPGEAADVFIAAPLADAPLTVAWSSDEELWAESDPVTAEELMVGDVAENVFNAFDTSHSYLVELAAGETVEVSGRSPQGDIDVEVVPPGLVYDAVAAYDPERAGATYLFDSDVGLYGLDVLESFTATTAGVYRFDVYIANGTTTAYRFSVTGTSQA
jgi:hypothetical protein